MAKFEGFQLVWLEAFVEVADNPKRMAAAAKMGITQGTVTKHLQKLELWLGRALVFDGTAELTADGQAFLPVARQILDLLDEARTPRVPAETPPAPRVSAKDLRPPTRAQTPKDG